MSLLEPEPISQSNDKSIAHVEPPRMSSTSITALIAALEDRLSAHELHSLSLTSSNEHGTLLQPHTRLLNRVTTMVESVERVIQGESSSVHTFDTAISSPMISQDEWLEIIRHCVSDCKGLYDFLLNLWNSSGQYK